VGSHPYPYRIAVRTRGGGGLLRKGRESRELGLRGGGRAEEVVRRSTKRRIGK